MTTSRDLGSEAGPPPPGRAEAVSRERREMVPLMASRVGDAYVRKAFFVDGATDLVTLCRALSERGLGDALVRDGEQIGIFTAGSLRDALLRPEPPAELAVREVATFDTRSVSVDDELFDAMLLMMRHRIHRVLVREGEAVVGILGPRADGVRGQPLAPDRAAGGRGYRPDRASGRRAADRKPRAGAAPGWRARRGHRQAWSAN